MKNPVGLHAYEPHPSYHCFTKQQFIVFVQLFLVRTQLAFKGSRHSLRRSLLPRHSMLLSFFSLLHRSNQLVLHTAMLLFPHAYVRRFASEGSFILIVNM